MARTLVLVSILLNCGLPFSVSQAQLFRGNAAPPAARESAARESAARASAAREPARIGLLGGLREAREERLRREEQAVTAAARAAAAQRNAATNLRANNNASGLPRSAGVAGNNMLGREPATNATQSLSKNQRSLEAAKADPDSRTASFRGPNTGTANRGQNNLDLVNANNKASNSLSRPSPVTPASATSFVPEPVAYDGPGVVIRLPKDARSVVNYLVDEVDTNVIRPGQQQVLDSKGSYVVRYSRGVTAEGRSFGESRYAIAEGRYRFELTATGWELYREPDADTNLAPPNRLDIAESQVGERSSYDLLLPEPSSQSELKRLLPSRSAGKPELTRNDPVSSEPGFSEPVASEPVASEPVASEPVSSAPAANEEVLPAPKPRSILE